MIYICLGVITLWSTIISVFIWIKYHSLLINIFELSKGMDMLYSNQEKLLELTKVKGFIKLVNEEMTKEKDEFEKILKERNEFNKTLKDKKEIENPKSTKEKEAGNKETEKSV